MRYLFGLLCLLVLAPGLGWAERTCTFAWDAVTQYTDGTPATGLAGYRLYTGAGPGGPYVLVQDVPLASLSDPTTPIAQAPCQPGEIFVVQAYDVDPGRLSAYSAEYVHVTLQAPTGVRVQEVIETSEEITTRRTRTVRWAQEE